MKDVFVLLVLLNAQTIKVCSQPYQADSNGNCRSPTEYLLDETNLCCKKCPPGQRLKEECSKTTETVCEPCPPEQHMEGWNYSPNCLSCKKCKSIKGLQNIQTCSSTTRAKCGCLPGMYCIMEFDDPYCSECRKYKQCKAGYGVSKPGTANSDVKCEQCPDGTFSETVSFTDRCQPHTNCHGRGVARRGNATSDTICKPEADRSDIHLQTSTQEPHAVQTTANTMMSTVSTTSDSRSPHEPSHSTLSTAEAVFNHSTKTPPPSTVSDSTLAAAIGSVIVIILIFIVVILVLLRIRKKDAVTYHPKVDANGNCATGDKINQGYLEQTQLTSLTSTEQKCLLEKGEACSDQSQCSTTTEILTRTDGCNSFESICPLQSTIDFYNPYSASDPLPLRSNIEPVTPQTSITTQSSSQPTSPQITSPMTTSPLVNVSITVSIEKGSGGPPSVIPTDLMQIDSKLPFGEKEESFSTPQQEAGKQLLMSVQESASYSA